MFFRPCMLAVNKFVNYPIYNSTYTTIVGGVFSIKLHHGDWQHWLGLGFSE